MNHFVLLALAATLGTWFVTALGAATVAFFKSPNQKAMNLMLGFASGVMIAASFWSLLQPAIERAETASTLPAYVVATTGFLLGALFMWGSDKIVSFARKNADSIQNQNRERLNRIIMLVLSITLHNIPEGLAVGVAFGALQRDGYTTERLPANLLQAQRDYFGAHTYERLDAPRGQSFHTNWTGEGGNTTANTYNA